MTVTKPIGAKISVHFASLTDARRWTIKHPLINFIGIGICAVICGTDDFVAIADFGRKKRKWFKKLLDLQNGIPSHDRFDGGTSKPSAWSSARRSATGRSAGASDPTSSAKRLSAKRFAAVVQGHWAIENELHWHLDVTFGEDHCRIRKGAADANFSALRSCALALLKKEKTANVGVKHKRFAAGWDEDYRLQVLAGYRLRDTDLLTQSRCPRGHLGQFPVIRDDALPPSNSPHAQHRVIPRDCYCSDHIAQLDSQGVFFRVGLRL